MTPNAATALAFRAVDDGIPILIIHGWTMSGSVEAHDFEPIFAHLPGYRRIYIDLPGMGDTPIGSTTNLDDMLDSVSGFISREILPRSPTLLLIGTSCGAYLARALAYEFADAVEGLMLRVPVVEPTSSERDVDPVIAAVIQNPSLMATLSDAQREDLGDVPVQTAAYLAALRRRAAATWIPAMAAADTAALDPIRDDLARYRLTRPMHTRDRPFAKPTLVLTGRQDADVGFRDAWALRDCYPRATFVALDRGSHGSPVDKGEEALFGALVRDWVGRVEEARRAGESGEVGGVGAGWGGVHGSSSSEVERCDSFGLQAQYYSN